ncbi:16S rRNA (cytosine(1402)-N(4))-methyltransferase RsmH [Desulfovibrio inopinatus]|uniref:16S rRNA (cytosine(1402)-N(4))-methyltransferase RsmH n=1 Tax=Desulfovibrio inopinatus TaxID=102109 RepID=UPI00040ED19A|nr:16S rRNA (cytosine(1402)-N(4))-methyltransferase RsmH [Desulfovibrio inopinatus]
MNCENTAHHVSVLLEETLDILDIRPGMRVLDATLGLGGHSRAMIERAGGDLELIGIDRDESALALAEKRLSDFPSVKLAHSPFSQFDEVLAALDVDMVDAVLADIGVSSLQLDDPTRGFGHRHDGPLDMRMDASGNEMTAMRLLEKASRRDIKLMIARLGEDPQAGRIASAIVRAREEGTLTSTTDLAEIVSAAYPAKWRATARQHPATRTFQALRMTVNKELEELREFLAKIVGYVRPGGRLAIISFHSLEDRIVKHTFRDEARDCICPPRQPFCTCGKVKRLEILTKKPIMAGEAEIAANPRARSAKLRAARRIG